MQVNNIESTTSFGSKGSLKRMLKLPGENAIIKDINKMTGDLVNKVYGKDIAGSLELRQLNRTGFEKNKKELGDLLSVDPQTDALIKDDVINIPYTSVIKLLDIISENIKKPISKLLPKIDKVPSLSSSLDQFKVLDFKNAHPEDFIEVFKMLSGVPIEKKAILIPYRELVENTSESAYEVITTKKNELAEELGNILDEKTYQTIKKTIIDYVEKVKKQLNDKNIQEQISTKFQELMNLYNSMHKMQALEKNIQRVQINCNNYQEALLNGELEFRRLLNFQKKELKGLEQLKKDSIEFFNKLLENFQK